MALIVAGATVTSGANLDATKLTGNLPAINGASVTSLNGSNIASGTVATARIPNLAASKITSGTMDGARISGGTFGSVNGSNISSLPAATSIPPIAWGAVGYFAFIYKHLSGTFNYNQTYSGGILGGRVNPASTSTGYGGTWRMGSTINQNQMACAQRVS